MNERNEVTIRNIDIPFLRMVVIALKWTLASLVVGAILAIPLFVLWTVVFVALLAQFVS